MTFILMIYRKCLERSERLVVQRSLARDPDESGRDQNKGLYTERETPSQEPLTIR